ncbi:MAG: efflux RND transporter permease subunit [Alphaproteobacteria bacterium]|nr:efflux RND transporter permease subunit [Alphaproteobacteria bacterium]
MALGQGLPALSVRRPYLAAVLNLLIIVAGAAAIYGVEVRELPDVDRPVVSVRANFPGGSPETIDAEITAKIEGAVARVNGITEVRSSSEEGNFRVLATFRPSVDLIDAANDIREAVARVQRELPDGVEDLSVIKADADSDPIVKLAVYSDSLPIEEVTRRVENDIIPELTSIAGVADIQLFGNRERVLRVVVDPMKLAGYGLSITDVVNVLRNARYDVPAGSFESDEQEVMVRADASVADPAAVEDLIVRDPVKLGDIGSASFGPADAESIVRLDGRQVVSLGVVRRAQSNTVTISQDIEKVVDRLNSRLRSLHIKVTSDDAVFIKGAIAEVLVSLGLAVVIVVAVIALFIGSLRASLIPAATIPVSLIGTVAAVWLMGFSVNLLTLLALVLATGLVVDDSIVVLENIQRLKSQGVKPRAAAILGSQQVFFAVIATTATLISVFVPISFLPSTAGRLFGEFGFVLAVTVCISSFVALTVVPMLASRLPEKTGPSPVERLLGGIGGGFARAYEKALDGVLLMPLVIVGLCGFVVFAATLTFATLGEELIPEEDRGLITVRLTGPDGVGLKYTDRQVEKVEQIIAPLVETQVATGLLSITGRYDLNRGQIDARLVDWSQRDMRGGEDEGAIARDVNKKLSLIPGAQARVQRGNSLGLRNADGGIRFALTGSNYEAIAEQAYALAEILEKEAPQVENLRVEFRATQPQLKLDIDRRRAADLGVPIENLAATAQVLVDSDEVAELTIDDQRVPVILQATAGSITDPADLNNLYVSATDGRLVPLSQMISLSEKAVPAELDRHGQRRAVEIFGDTAADYTLRDAVEAIKVIADRQVAPGYSLLFLDEAADLDETSHGVTITYALALLIVFLVLVAQFESITSAAIVLITVPFGVCAAIFAMALTGTSINIYSQIGVLMLIGIMAKNSILMVEFADQLRENGMKVYEAAREASIVRLRPIAMTMLSTVLAGVPLIYGTGPGAESRASIGWVVFGGLGLAGIFTLLLTPALYVLIAGFSRPRSETATNVDGELAEAATTKLASEAELAGR